MKLWKIIRRGMWVSLAAIFVAAAMGASADIGGILTLVFWTLLIASSKLKAQDPEVREAKAERRKKQQEEREAKKAKNREKVAKAEVYRREALAASLSKKTIVEVKYLGGGTQTTKSGGLGGAILGGMVAGPLGAVVGASRTKNGDQKQRFAVKYDDGRVVIKEVYPNGWEYKELMKYVKWEDLK